MKKTSQAIFASLMAGWMLLLIGDAKAVLMEFHPSSQNVALGGSVTADLWIVGSNPALGIGAYDISLN